MTSEALWQRFCKENQEFRTEGFSFNAKGLRRFFDIVYQQGYDEGREDCFANTDSYHEVSSDMPDFFKDIFKR